MSGLLEDVRTPVVLVLNKIDLVAKPRLLPLIERVQKWHAFAAIVPVSATTGDGIDRLERALLERLPESEPIYPDDYLTDQPERAIVAEIVREKVLHHTRAELPFSTAVVVDQFDESERDRHPAALLHDLRRTGVAEADRDRTRRRHDQARSAPRPGRTSKRFFDTRVFLDLRVKVNPDWRNNERALDELGVPKTARRPGKRRR